MKRDGDAVDPLSDTGVVSLKPTAPGGTAVDPALAVTDEDRGREASAPDEPTAATPAKREPVVVALTPIIVPSSSEAASRYEGGQMIGSGGMGEVRVKRDRHLGRDVAWKTVRAGHDPGDVRRKRFLREARVQGQLEHPSIVPLYDIGTTADGEMFFTMRRVRGATLADIIGGNAATTLEMEVRFSRRKLLRAFVSVCLAIDFAHRRGVVHRDLKPANVIFGDYGEVYV